MMKAVFGHEKTLIPSVMSVRLSVFFRICQLGFHWADYARFYVGDFRENLCREFRFG
jgi:hypothetical protein